MSAAPGWFPDPGGSGQLRYWDGQRWTEHLSAPTGPTPTPEGPTPSGGRPVLWIVVAAVVALALVVGGIWWFTRATPGTNGPTGTGGVGGSTASPTISGWDEQDTPSASPEPSPTPSETQVAPVPCAYIYDSAGAQAGSVVTGGGLSFPAQNGWYTLDFPVSSILTDAGTQYRDLTGSSWQSTLEVGYAEGFDDEQTAARTVLDCYFTSGADHGYESSEVLKSEEVTVDGQTGWWLKVREHNSDVPGNSAILHAIVFDLGDPEGMRVFWTTAYEADPEAVDQAEAAREGLRVIG